MDRLYPGKNLWAEERQAPHIHLVACGRDDVLGRMFFGAMLSFQQQVNSPVVDLGTVYLVSEQGWHLVDKPILHRIPRRRTEMLTHDTQAQSLWEPMKQPWSIAIQTEAPTGTDR
jgi:hypothetical protein